MAFGECTLFRLPHLATVYHFTHVCSYSCSLPPLLSLLSSSPVLLNVGVGSAVLEVGVGVIGALPAVFTATTLMV